MPHESIAAHYAQLIGLGRPWQLSRAEVSHSDQEVRIFLARAAPSLRRSECEFACGAYDKRGRRSPALEAAGNLIANTRRRCPSRKGPNQMLTQGVERLYSLTCMNGRQLLTQNEVRPILHLSESASLKESTSTRASRCARLPAGAVGGELPVANRDRDPAFGTEVGHPVSGRVSLVMSP